MSNADQTFIVLMFLSTWGFMSALYFALKELIEKEQDKKSPTKREP